MWIFANLIYFRTATVCFLHQQPANWKWWFYGIVFKWWFLGLSLSLHHWEKPVCSSTLFSVFFCFLLKPLKLSVPGNNYMFPRGSPNIQGIRRHLACKSLFLSLTLCIAFYFPPLSSTLAILSASQLYKHSISLGGLIHSSLSLLTFQPTVFDEFLIFCALLDADVQYTALSVFIFTVFFNFIKSARNASILWEGRNLNIISVRFFTPRL